MKKIITVIALFCSMNTFAQCTNPSGNYELSISNDANRIIIKARNTNGAIRLVDDKRIIDDNFVGMTFGVKWSAKSDIVLGRCNSTAPFDIKSYKELKEKDNFKFQTYGDAADSAPMISKDFISKEWKVIATIPYTGNLAESTSFELVECGFDEHTNPYFGQMSHHGEYAQFSPKIVHE